MNQTLAQSLLCTDCKHPLSAQKPHTSSTQEWLAEGILQCTRCKQQFPIINGIPRFVESENYAQNFGIQWNHFRTTQLDSASGLTISSDRFYSQSKWTKSDLKGKNVLDIGCGAGRFTEIAVGSGANVYAIDYSNAVDACAKSLGNPQNLLLVQADIFNLPFPNDFFDFIFCFGVLQHTPNAESAFLSIPPYLKPGGSIAVDIYEKRWGNYLRPKKWLRPVTTRMSKQKLFKTLKVWVPRFLVLNRYLRKIPIVGKYSTRFVPVADYTGIYPLSETQVAEWALMDTFDWLGPTYDTPQTLSTLERWFNKAELVNIEVENPNFVVGRGTK